VASRTTRSGMDEKMKTRFLYYSLHRQVGSLVFVEATGQPVKAQAESPPAFSGFGRRDSGGRRTGIFTIQTGLPFTPLIGGDPLGLNNSDAFAYPDRLRGSGCHSLVNPGSVDNSVKLRCFALPMATPAIAAQCVTFQPGGAPNPIAVGTCSSLLGNGGRNEINGPGLVNVDFSLFKNNQTKENLNLQFS
jgi:hypothetical protein